MNELSLPVFRPREGAVLDLASLRVLAAAPSEVLRAWLTARQAGATGIVLEGLEVEGEAAPVGPPGTVRPDGLAGGALVSPGRALITARDGTMHLVEVPDPMHVPWPDASGPRVRGDLVLFASHLTETTEAGLAVAREELRIRVGFVKPDLADQPHLLTLARALGNGQDWATDIARVIEPEHGAIRQLLKRLERLEHAVWKAEPEGAVWDRQVLGRSWVRYQTVAVAALQATAMQLETVAMTTKERVRLLAALKDRLERSVERVATEMMQTLGTVEGVGAWALLDGGAR
jgi:hypothetical protein